MRENGGLRELQPVVSHVTLETRDWSSPRGMGEPGVVWCGVQQYSGLISSPCSFPLDVELREQRCRHQSNKHAHATLPSKSTRESYLVLGDEPARVVRVLVDELLGDVGAGKQEDRAVARLQEGPAWDGREGGEQTDEERTRLYTHV